TDLSTIAAGTITSWSWSFGDGTSSVLQNPSHCYPISGSYNVGLTVTSNNGCSSTLIINQFIDVFLKPNAEFTPNPNPASVFNGDITMNNGSSSDVNYWYWDFGDGDTLAPWTSSPVHTFPTSNPGIYNVTLIVHNADGCYDTVVHPVEVGPEFTFFIPNCVTPNDDGVNDFFFGDGVGIVKYDIWIFDRWGMEIFHGKYLYDKWDGRANDGKDIAQQDVYVWKVRLTDVFDRKHNYIGTVTIVK
ncbi:MAG TPA: PKD domain-containing protein, partial [Bacteroidia bacterium]